MSPAKMVDIIVHHGDGMETVMMRTGLSREKIEEIILDEGNVERCPTCLWYCPAYELINDETDEPDGHCDNCR